MFGSLSNNLTKIFDKLTKRGFLTEDDINAAMREVRIALLEADVALPVVKDFINQVKAQIVGKEVVKSISPGQMVIKLVQDSLTEMLGSEVPSLNLHISPPAIIMMVGLQGSGKTTTSAKIAMRLKEKQGKKVLLASLDVARPAAQEQLQVLAERAKVGSLPIITGEKPLTITKRALETARLESYDVVILDTAGRLHIDDELMNELKEIKELAKPIETLFVADAMTGQDAVNTASLFHSMINITGAVLTRIDGDTRGGAALSIRAITGMPIKFLGIGEKLAELEEFHPARIASRILDMGDVVSLVEKAAELVNQQEAEDLAKKMQKGTFDLNDLASQIKGIRKMGGISSMMNMLPGIQKFKDQVPDSSVNEKILARQEAIISAMTPKERKDPRILNASRRRRIASGAGVSVQDINKLLKQYQDMSTMMKKLGKMSKKPWMMSQFSKMFS